MDQPAYWGVLAGLTVLALGARLVARQPLWRRRAVGVPTRELALAAAAAVILVFHCAAMFFAEWVAAVPFADAAASAVRDLDSIASQVTYWVPAGALVVALRRVWAPALLSLSVALLGVGYTMFVPHELTTHLVWLAAAVVGLVLVGTALVHPAAPGERAVTDDANLEA